MAALLDMDQLRTFIAIADAGTFTRAAEVVHKTQSAVSMQVKKLEETVGRTLFEREGRASRLTEEGERLLDYCRRSWLGSPARTRASRSRSYASRPRCSSSGSKTATSTSRS